MSSNFTVLHRQEEAHDDGIWTVDWVKNGEDEVDRIVTGWADGHVKVGTWVISIQTGENILI